MLEFKLPQLAEGVESADVAEVHIQPGQMVEPGQTVMELETDKAVMELPSTVAGKVAELLVKKGDTVHVGQVIFRYTSQETAEHPTDTAPVPQERAAVSDSMSPRAQGNGDLEGSVSRKESTRPALPPTSVQAAPQVWRDPKLPVPAGPLTRRLARELGLDLHAIVGTGRGGRITPEDVARAFAAQSAPSPNAGIGLVAPPLPDFSQFGPIERQAYSRLQKTAAQHLSLSWQLIPHVTQHDLADITDIEAARKRFVETAGKDAPKVTMTAITMKAVVACLQQFPQFNASYDAQKGELIIKKYYHLGVAVDTPAGLVVPVIRHVDQKSVVQLAQELTSIADKARQGKLTLEEMRGGTFTITNLGGIGGTAFTPIVNYPEVAILGMSRAQKQLILKDNQLQERLMLPLSLSYDHRVINGADAARFLVRLASMFQDPFRLLVEC